MSDERDNIFSRIYGNNPNPINNNDNNNNNEQRDFDAGMDDDKPNILFAILISFFSLLISGFLLVSLVLAFSYDLCIFLDSYYIYIAIVIGLFLAYSVYQSIAICRCKFSIVAIINIIFSLVALFLIIVPFIFGLLYF